jgi:tetratricopeptide (TPR) repeat protein
MALQLVRLSLGPDDPRLIPFLNELGVVCKFAGRFDRSDAAYREALRIAESGPVADHSGDDTLATLLHNLGGLDHARGRPRTGEQHARRGLALRAARNGAHHASVACDLAALGALVEAQGRLDEAEVLYERALLIWSLQPADPADVGSALSNLAAIEHQRGHTDRAEATYRRALDVRQQALGPHHPDLAPTLNNLALLLKSSGRASEAAPLYRRALAICERQLTDHHPTLLTCRANVARLEADREAVGR